VAAGVGAAVAVAGVIAFVGLVIPHLLRLSAGPMHRTLILGCVFLGGALLTASDIVARTIAAPAEVPVGVVTAILGAPYFLYLVQRNRAALGG
jgi:iron complex transport system permease protein